VNDIVNNPTLTALRPADAWLAAVLARPKAVAIGCVVALTALGWGLCGFMLAAPEWFLTLCRPVLGRALSAPETALAFTMWVAMTLAMMLPTAGPMILTYAEIADTAARKAERVASPLFLAAGYTAVWLGFACIAAALQIALAATAPANTGIIPTLIAAVLFLIAGMYQFSSLKRACLTLCQRPFPFFFANWTATRIGVFNLGLRQGIYCLGCCWAMMLLMFAAGSMNLIWMAALGAVMTIEKMATTMRFARALGIMFIAIAVAFVFMEFS
jgi:predicted metal-binding membrane protein